VSPGVGRVGPRGLPVGRRAARDAGRIADRYAAGVIRTWRRPGFVTVRIPTRDCARGPRPANRACWFYRPDRGTPPRWYMRPRRATCGIERTLIGPQVWRLVTRGDSRARQPLLRPLNRRAATAA